MGLDFSWSIRVSNADKVYISYDGASILLMQVLLALLVQ